MPSVASKFADENVQLRSELAESKAENQALRKRCSELTKELRDHKREFSQFRRDVAKLLKNQPNSTALIDDGQLTLFGAVEPEETPEHAKEAPDGETSEDLIRQRHKPKRRAKKIDMSQLPRETVTHELAEDQRICPVTGMRLVPIGEKTFEELDYVAAQLRVIVHRMIKYGPEPEVPTDRVVQSITASLPPRALEGCMASASLLANLLVNKYRFHLPLYRQEEAFQSAGLFIPRSTLCDWVMKAAFELRPIAAAIEKMIRAGPILQLDDTLVKCQAGKGHGNFQAYLWTFASPGFAGTCFRFTKGRKTEDLAPILSGSRASILLGDAYAGNVSAAREAGLNVQIAGCWAHVLRKFRDASSEAGAMVRLYLDDIRKLYDIEDEANENGLKAKDRAALRQAKGRPIIARMLRRTLGWKDLFSLQGKMADALKYIRNSRKALTTYLSHGDIPIDNNACERSIRPIAVGRRNWLFAGSVRGGEAAATIYTLIECCRAVDVEPAVYLEDVLTRVASHPCDRIEDLVPSNWKALAGSQGR